MELQEMLHALDALQRKNYAYQHALGLLYYDGATVAPKGAADNRGESMAILAGEQYRFTTCEETRELLDGLWAREGELDEPTRRMVYLLRKDQEEMQKIPEDEYVAFQKLTNDAEAVWHEAKIVSDYAAFEPYLSKIVETLKKFAGYVKPDMDPYEYWLDAHEEGMTRAACEAFFGALREKMVPLIQRINAQADRPRTDFLSIDAPVDKQRALSDFLMGEMGVDRAHCGIGETEHPFTIGFTKYDNRITTHYHESAFSSSLFSVVHESGHAMYDMGVRDEFAYTCLGEGVSMGVHESQSRFFENIIGRSRAFVARIAPKLRELFPQLCDVTDEELYRGFNESHPSLIRTEADELTYCLHIMVRYELEKRLFDGEITTKELPAAWNRLYREYLGVDVPSDATGVLQDSHWSGGSFGYFPSYALGSAYGAQLLAKMNEEFDVFASVEKGDMAPVKGWLGERIWQHGKLYAPKALMERAFGGPFDPKFYTDYLEKKFSEIYGL